MDVAQLLTNSLSADASLRANATEQLEAAASSRFDEYMSLLSQQLASESAQSHIRNAAGLALKNALSAKDLQRREERQGKWQALSPHIKQQIKDSTLNTLNSNDGKAGQSAAQFMAAIAAIELPSGQWPELMNSLVANISPNHSEHVKQASLQAIGYICESVDPEVLAGQSNQILTAVVSGANNREPSKAVRLAALSALYDSLDFIRENFEREGERNYIMQVICEATQDADTNIKVASFGCLVRIMQLYYDKMRFYMEKALFGLTVLGMNVDDERVSLQAVEFWSTVCEEEIEVNLEIQEALEVGEKPERECFQFARVALPEVLPVLLQLLCKQDEDADEDEWNVSMAAGTCLQLFAQCVEGIIVQPVLGFIEQSLRSNNWKEREAGVMAFGSILEGPSPEMLKPLVSQALGILIPMMNDPTLQVKDTTAWTLGRISDLVVGAINLETQLPAMIQALITGLNDNPRIISNCCWALMNLSEQLGSTDESTTSRMSAYYEQCFAQLLRVADSGTNEHNSRTSAYEALATMVAHAAQDVLPLISNLSTVVLERIQSSTQLRGQIVSTEDKLQFEELQSNLLSVLTSIIRRCGSDIRPISDNIMNILLALEQSQPKQSVVHEDIFLAISSLCNAVNAHFSIYLDSFAPFLYAALANPQEHVMCGIAVGLIGDISRALGENILPYCDNFMTQLLQNLQSPALERAVKPAILSCFNDIALAINGHFAKYLSVVMGVLGQASGVKYSQDSSYDQIDYVNGLREGIVDAYVGAVQALTGTNEVEQLKQYVPGIFAFLQELYVDAEKTESLHRAMIGLIGDFAAAFPNGDLKPILQADWITECLKQARAKNGNPQATKEAARYATENVKQACR